YGACKEGAPFPSRRPILTSTGQAAPQERRELPVPPSQGLQVLVQARIPQFGPGLQATHAVPDPYQGALHRLWRAHRVQALHRSQGVTPEMNGAHVASSRKVAATAKRISCKAPRAR